MKTKFSILLVYSQAKPHPRYNSQVFASNVVNRGFEPPSGMCCYCSTYTSVSKRAKTDQLGIQIMIPNSATYLPTDRFFNIAIRSNNIYGANITVLSHVVFLAFHLTVLSRVVFSNMLWYRFASCGTSIMSFYRFLLSGAF